MQIPDDKPLFLNLDDGITVSIERQEDGALWLDFDAGYTAYVCIEGAKNIQKLRTFLKYLEIE